MKKKRIITILSGILILLVVAFSAIYLITKPEIQTGDKSITVTVIYEDKTKKAYSIKTDAEYLADALLEKKIITEKSKNGLYTVIDGQRADYNLDGSWWCLTKNHQEINLGINDQPIADGDKYEITNTPS